MRQLILTCIIIFSLSTNSHAVPVSGIAKFFKVIASEIDSIFNVGKKAVKDADQTVDIGKNTVKQSDEANIAVVSDEVTRSAIDSGNIASINKFSSNINLQTLHKSNSNQIGKIHRLDDLSEVFQFDDFTQDDEFANYVLVRWVGHVLRTINYLNKQNTNTKLNEKRIILQCIHEQQIFTFTIDEISKNTKIAYLSYQINKNKGRVIDKQKLHVLDDTTDHLLLSVKKQKNKNFPTDYFIIYADQRFEHLFYRHGITSPELIKIKINSGAKKNYNNKCYRNILNQGPVVLK